MTQTIELTQDQLNATARLATEQTLAEIAGRKSSNARGHFGELLNVPAFAKSLIEDLDGEAYETGIESDKKLRGSSVNVSLYAFDEAQGLALIQVRQCIFHPRRFNEVKKDYFLVGRNENGEAFAHPCDVRAAGRVVSDDVTAGIRVALCKIWDVKEKELPGIIRNGDVAFIPVKALPEGARRIESKAITLRETHHVRTLKGGELWATGHRRELPAITPESERVPFSGKTITPEFQEQCRQTWIKNGYVEIEPGVYWLPLEYFITGPASIKHSKGQHPTVRATGKRKVWRVAAGKRAETWGFARPTSD